MIIGHYQGLYEQSGVGAYLRRIISAQQAQGHEVLYFDLPEGYPPAPRRVADEDVEVQDNRDLFEQARGRGVDILHVHHLLEELPEEGLAVIRTVHNHRPYCPTRYRYLRRRGRPCPRKHSFPGCLWGMAVDSCGARRPDRWIRDFQATNHERAVLPRMQSLAVSHFVKGEMVRNGYPADRIDVLHLPAPARREAKEPPTEGIPRFLHMGRIEAPKGLRKLLHALARVSVPVHLDVAGEGPLRSEMEQLTRALGLEEQVTFYGWLQKEDLEALIESARALAFPSECHEAGGTAAFEAMAQARAVLMSRVGGMPEVVLHEETGLILPHGDVDAWAEAITMLAQDHERAWQMGKQGRALVETNYSLSIHMEQLHGYYNKVVNMCNGNGT